MIRKSPPVRPLALLVLLCLLLPGLAVSQSLPATLPDALGRTLINSSWAEREELAKQLASRSDQQASALAEYWLSGQLYVLKENYQLVSAIKEGRRYQVTVLATGEALGLLKKRVLKKIPINNKLRKVIRDTLALKDLQSPDIDLRRNAIISLLKSTEAETREQLNALKHTETWPALQQLIEEGIALFQLQDENQQTRIDAATLLAESNTNVVYNKLNSLRLQLEQSGQQPELQAAINKSISKIDERRKLYGAAENIFFALSLGSVLLLSAIGLAITFGVMGVINMAHGEMIMLGAYTTYVVQSLLPNHIGASLFISLPLAFVVAGLTGVLIERLVIRHLYGRPLETLLATFGVSLILQQLVRSVFSPLNQTVITPEWMSGSIVINDMLSLTVNRLVIIGFSLMVFLGLLFILRYTRAGLTMRAVTQNRAMAGSMGIRTGHVDALTFGLGSGIAGIAGVTLSQLTNVGPNLGQNYIIDSFMVVVFGGVGNLWGTFVAAMGLGITNKLIEPWTGAVIAKILILVFIILFIQKRPRGLFALKGRAVE